MGCREDSGSEPKGSRKSSVFHEFKMTPGCCVALRPRGEARWPIAAVGLGCPRACAVTAEPMPTARGVGVGAQGVLGCSLRQVFSGTILGEEDPGLACGHVQGASWQSRCAGWRQPQDSRGRVIPHGSVGTLPPRGRPRLRTGCSLSGHVIRAPAKALRSWHHGHWGWVFSEGAEWYPTSTRSMPEAPLALTATDVPRRHSGFPGAGSYS